MIGAGLIGAGFARGAPGAAVALAMAATVASAGSGVTLGVAVGASSGAPASAIGVSAAAALTIAAGLTVGPRLWLQTLTPRRPSPATPSAPRPSTATHRRDGLEICPVDLIELLDVLPVLPAPKFGVGALDGSATGALCASPGVELANEGTGARTSAETSGNDAPLGAGAPSTPASSRINMEALSNRSRANLAVARTNHASNAGGSAVPRRAARAVAASGGPAITFPRNVKIAGEVFCSSAQYAAPVSSAKAIWPIA